MENRMFDRRINERRSTPPDSPENVIIISLIAIAHGGFWMAAGVVVGRILWGS